LIDKIRAKVTRNLKDKHFFEILMGSAMSFGIKVLTVIIGLIVNLLVAKYYGAEIVGTLALVTSLMAIAGMVSLLGMDVSVLRFVPPLLEKKEYFSIYKIIKTSFLFVVFLSMVISLSIYMFSDFIAVTIFKKENLVALIELVSFFIVFQVSGKFSLSTIRALKNIKLFLALQFLPSVLNLIILLVVTFFFYALYNPIYSQLASQSIVALISIWFLKKYLSKYEKKSYQKNTSLKEIILTSFPMFLTTVMQMVVLQTDVVMLSSMSTLGNVGIYSIVMKLALLSSFIITSINTIIAPKFSELYYNDNINELKNVSKKSTKLIFYATLPISIILIVFGEELLRIFGEGFRVGSFALVMLAIGQLVNAMSGSVGYFLNMTGHEKTLNKIVLLGAISNIILNILFIPEYGINGAAFASMISMILWNIIASVYVKKQFGFYIGYIPLISNKE